MHWPRLWRPMRLVLLWICETAILSRPGVSPLDPRGKDEKNQEVSVLPRRKPELGAVPDAAGRAEVPRNVDPGTAADHTATAVATLQPSRSVGRGINVTVVRDVLAPLPHIAVDVVKPPRIGRKIADRHGAFAIPTLAAAALVNIIAVVIGLRPCDGQAPPERRCGARAGDILPFGLGEVGRHS